MTVDFENLPQSVKSELVSSKAFLTFYIQNVLAANPKIVEELFAAARNDDASNVFFEKYVSNKYPKFLKKKP